MTQDSVHVGCYKKKIRDTSDGLSAKVFNGNTKHIRGVAPTETRAHDVCDGARREDVRLVRGQALQPRLLALVTQDNERTSVVVIRDIHICDPIIVCVS